jgi:hypothetical protein
MPKRCGGGRFLSNTKHTDQGQEPSIYLSLCAMVNQIGGTAGGKTAKRLRFFKDLQSSRLRKSTYICHAGQNAAQNARQNDAACPCRRHEPSVLLGRAFFMSVSISAANGG